MGIKEIYDFLELTEDGKKVLESSKAEVEELKDARAKARKVETELQKATADLADFAALKKKITDAGIDINDPAASVQKVALEQKAVASEESNREVGKIREQMNALQGQLEAEKKTREATEQRARTERLRNEFGGILRESMGKYGEMLAENLITKGAVKFDEKGAIIYDVGDKIYTLDAAIETLKVEHKDYITPKAAGSNMPPPTTGSGIPAVAGNPAMGGKTGEEIGKTSATTWFKMGVAEATGKQ